MINKWTRIKSAVLAGSLKVLLAASWGQFLASTDPKTQNAIS